MKRLQPDANDLILSTIQEFDKERKSRKKETQPGSKKKEKGLTLEDIEKEEGGVIKESQVASASLKRAAARRQANRQHDDIGASIDDTGDEIGGSGAPRGPPPTTGAADGATYHGKGKQTQHAQQDGVDSPNDQPSAEGGSGSGQKQQQGSMMNDPRWSKADDVEIEAFNMNSEQSLGSFNEEGVFVFKKKGAGGEDEEGERDNWLDSGDAQLLPPELAAAIEARNEATAKLLRNTGDASAKLSSSSIARLQYELAKLMEKGGGGGGSQDSVQDVMNRCAGGVKKIGRAGKQIGGKVVKEQPAAPANLTLFNQLVDASNTLLSEGIHNVYSMTRGQLRTAASLLIDLSSDDEDNDLLRNIPRAKDIPKVGGGEGQSMVMMTCLGTGGGGGGDDDMFGDAGGGVQDQAAQNQDQQQQARNNDQQQAQQNQQQQAQYIQQFADWPVAELKRYLAEHTADTSTCLDKSDLVKLCADVAARGPEGEGEGGGVGGEGVHAPPGYVWDPGCGYYFNEQSGYYFDGGSGYYYKDGVWYFKGGDGEMVAQG